MAALYKRATPPQAMLLRVVEGSIKNACDAHSVAFDPYFARSIAKRAAGTLSGCWPDVLAAKPSEKTGEATKLLEVVRSARKADLTKPSVAPTLLGAKDGAVSWYAKAVPLRQIEKWMFSQLRAIKASGNTERAQAFIDVLRQISVLQAEQSEAALP